MSQGRLTAALADRYRMERELGAGGMATVYLAEDLKHDRKVAIKVLKPELTAVLGAERFVQEIKTTAQLQHPHILPLHDSGTADGFLFYVMPYIEGETLRDKLDREAQLGIDEAVRITREVADALDYAHRNGIIHRDIKPENILLHDGRPMVADFGIALAVSAAAGGRMTETGTSIGTPHYMSPEQATADKEITGRADIYSLASVLYEMLSGSPPHVGSSAQQVIMKIIADTPRAVTELRKSVPPNVAAAVMKALEKLPADRFDSAKAFADALADPHFTSASIVATPVVGPMRASAWVRSPLSWVSLVLVTGLGAGTAWLLTRPQPERPVTRFEINLPRGLLGTPFDISRDGRRIVSRAGDTVYIRDLDDVTLRALYLPGGSPRLSPDGNDIAYSGGDSTLAAVTAGAVGRGNVTLQVVGADGGTPTALLDSITPASYRWADDGRIYVVRNGVLGRVPATGGAFEALMLIPRDTDRFRRNLVVDDVLPDGRGVLVSRQPSGGLQAITFDGAPPRLIGETWSNGRILPGGYLAWVERQGTDRAMIAPFDAESFRLTGDPLPIADVTRVSVAWSDEGTVLYDNTGSPGWRMIVGDRSGTIRVLTELVDPGGASVSPDGSRVATVRQRSDDIWLLERAAGTVRPLTFASDSASKWVSGWTPDGSHLYYTASPGRQVRSDSSTVISFASPDELSRLMAIDVDNPGEPDTISSFPHRIYRAWVAPNGRSVVWVPSPERPGAPEPTVWSAALPTGDAREVLAVPAGRVSDPRVSPDGRWILYTSTEAGREEVYLQAYPTGGRKLQISSDGGRLPFWGRSGTSAFYTRQDQLWEARLDPAASRVTDRTMLIDHRSSRLFWHQSFPGDNEFIGTTADLIPGEPARFMVVQGILSEIERRLRGQR